MYKRIKELRIQNHLTQKDISKKLQISQSLYSLYESSKKEIPLNILIILSKEYHTSIDYIIENTNQKAPHKRTI